MNIIIVADLIDIMIIWNELWKSVSHSRNKYTYV